VLLVNLAPHFLAFVRILSLPERFSLAFQLNRAVESMRLGILAFQFVFNPHTTLPLSWAQNVRGRRAVRVCFDLELLFDLRYLAGRD
jgi:hypothetical protein